MLPSVRSSLDKRFYAPHADIPDLTRLLKSVWDGSTFLAQRVLRSVAGLSALTSKLTMRYVAHRHIASGMSSGT